MTITTSKDVRVLSNILATSNQQRVNLQRITSNNWKITTPNSFLRLHSLKSDNVHKKWSFTLRISSVSCGFGHIYWRKPEWKTSFFVQCYHHQFCYETIHYQTLDTLKLELPALYVVPAWQNAWYLQASDFPRSCFYELCYGQWYGIMDLKPWGHLRHLGHLKHLRHLGS